MKNPYTGAVQKMAAKNLHWYLVGDKELYYETLKQLETLTEKENFWEAARRHTERICKEIGEMKRK